MTLALTASALRVAPAAVMRVVARREDREGAFAADAGGREGLRVLRDLRVARHRRRHVARRPSSSADGRVVALPPHAARAPAASSSASARIATSQVRDFCHLDSSRDRCCVRVRAVLPEVEAIHR